MAFRRQRLPNDLTPEEREARIAELRARRRARARTLAPVESGEYINSFRILLVRRKQLRIVGYVINDAPHSMLIEMKYGVMTKARRARG